jgi:hypothetical protein
MTDQARTPADVEGSGGTAIGIACAYAGGGA